MSLILTKLLGRRWSQRTVRSTRRVSGQLWQRFSTWTTKTTNVKTIVVALSGGVDSSVAAALLKKQLECLDSSVLSLSSTVDNNVNDSHKAQIQLQAVHMTNWNQQDDDNDEDDSDSVGVCYEQDYKDAQKVADYLHLPLIRQRWESEYWSHVFEPYLDDLIQNGNMGNPDINCNVYIKFGALRQDVMQRFGGPDCTWLATGHYARLWYSHNHNNHKESSWISPLLRDYTELVEQSLFSSESESSSFSETFIHYEWLWKQQQQQQQLENNNIRNPLLLAAADTSKDQSYFLAGCSNAQLAQVMFPLGDFFKKNQEGSNAAGAQTVRQVAEQWNLPTAQKRESMGICFVGKKRQGWKRFVQEYLSKEVLRQPVSFVDIDTGRVLGQSEEPSHPVLYTTGRGAKVRGLDQRYFCVGPRQGNPSSNSNNNNPTENHNIVWVCAGTHHPALYASSFTVKHMNWMLNGQIPEPLQKSGGILHCHCRYRHLQPLMECLVSRCDDGTGAVVYTVRLLKPSRAIQPGQMLVLYAGLVCLGGGPISSRGPTQWEERERER